MIGNLGNLAARTIPKLTALAALGIALALAGCVTAENSLSQNDIANMKLTAVTVGFAPNALVIGEDGAREMLGAKIKAGVEQAMADQLVGARPVRLDIVVKRFKIPSAGSRILIGGDPEMFASATLVDARTGAVIIAHPELQTFVPGGHGLIGVAVRAAIDNSMKQTPEEQLIAQYGQAYRGWLTHRA